MEPRKSIISLKLNLIATNEISRCLPRVQAKAPTLKKPANAVEFRKIPLIWGYQFIDNFFKILGGRVYWSIISLLICDVFIGNFSCAYDRQHWS